MLAFFLGFDTPFWMLAFPLTSDHLEWLDSRFVLKFMKDFGTRVTEATVEKCAKSFLFQSLSINLQRGIALCVMGAILHHQKLEEIYNLGTIQEQEG